ncbi:hypothetical protein J8F10_13760 [Gemmata sp. G18]|uniref:DedA family protein n=1 Tax=Gemmata palustris TaxID=2822762 RepID=A0ABS5BRJ2_9BACT|nr:hypothetical protein [Gemmata palustris]
MAVAFCAAIAGDNLGFWLGRRVARAQRLDAGRRFLFLTPEHEDRGAVLREVRALTVFIARFITGLRVIAGPAAGASGMRWGGSSRRTRPRAVWAVAMAFIGHFAGHAWEAMQHRLGQAAWIVLAVVAVGFVTWRVSTYLRKGSVPEPPPA